MHDGDAPRQLEPRRHERDDAGQDALLELARRAPHVLRIDVGPGREPPRRVRAHVRDLRVEREHPVGVEVEPLERAHVADGLVREDVPQRQGLGVDAPVAPRKGEDVALRRVGHVHDARRLRSSGRGRRRGRGRGCGRRRRRGSRGRGGHGRRRRNRLRRGGSVAGLAARGGEREQEQGGGEREQEQGGGEE